MDREWAEEQLEGETAEDVEAIEPAKSREGFPFSILEQMEVFQDLVDCAERQFENITGGIKTEKPGCSDLKINHGAGFD